MKLKKLKLTDGIKYAGGVVALMGALVALSFVGGGDVRPEVTAIPVKNVNTDTWSFVNTKGNVVFENLLPSAPSLPVNGVFALTDSATGLKSLYRLRKEIIPMGEDLTGLKEAGIVADNVIPVVRPGSHIEYYSNTGLPLFTLDSVCGRRVTAVRAAFTSNRGVFRTEDRRCGAIAPDGTVVVPPVYDNISTFGNGYALAESTTETGSPVTYLIDKDGNVKETFMEARIANDFFCGRGFVNVAGTIFEVRPDGFCQPVLGKVYQILDFSGDYIVFLTEFGEYGVIDETYDSVIPVAAYDSIVMVTDDTFLVHEHNGNYALVDSGNKILHYFYEPEVYAIAGRNLSPYVNLDSEIAIVAANETLTRLYAADGTLISEGLFTLNPRQLSLPQIINSNY